MFLTGGGFLPSASKSLVITLFVISKAKHAPPIGGGEMKHNSEYNIVRGCTGSDFCICDFLNDPHFLGSAGSYDSRLVEKLERLETLIRKRRMALTDFCKLASVSV